MGILIKDGIQYGNQPDISGKVDKVTGKGLSTNDYTDADKQKLAKSASTLQLENADWNDIYGKLNSVNAGNVSTFYSGPNVSKLLTNNAVSVSLKGLVLKMTSATYDFMAMLGDGGSYNEAIATWRITDVSANGATIGAFNKYHSSYSEATESVAGLMSAVDKQKLTGIEAGAQVNTITGVKGNAEGSYRTGNVNITPANVGAVAKLDSPSETTNGIAFTEMEGAVEFREIPGDESFIIRLHVGGQDSVSYRIYGTPDVTYIQRYDAVKGWTAYQRITNEYTDADKQKLAGIMDGVLVIDCGTVSSLPKTISNSAITANMVVVSSTIGNPAAQSGDWTVTTTAGSLTISGSISGSTTLVLYLCNGI